MNKPPDKNEPDFDFYFKKIKAKFQPPNPNPIREDLIALNEPEEEIDLNAETMPDSLKGMDKSELETQIVRLERDRAVEINVI